MPMTANQRTASVLCELILLAELDSRSPLSDDDGDGCDPDGDLCGHHHCHEIGCVWQKMKDAKDLLRELDPDNEALQER